MKDYNPFLTTVASFIVGLFLSLDAIGLIALKLYKRFFFETIIGIFLGLLIMYAFPINRNVAIFLYTLTLVWLLYTTYDTYRCTKAKNQHKSLPKIFGKFDIQ